MSIKSDRWIRRMARERGMIEPFVDAQGRQVDAQGRRVISYGLSSYGYDMRVAPEFKIFTNVLSAIVDPKDFDHRSFVEFDGDVCIVPPNSFALARSVEYFRIPRDVLTICVGKSTYARCGIITNVTPFEPEWEGHVTLEISNTTPLPARSTPTRASARCSSSRPTRTTSARPATPTRPASTSGRRASRCRSSKPESHATTSRSSSPWRAAPLAAQQPDSNAPTQPARPLNLQPALKPPVADTGIFSPLAAAPAERDPARRRRPRAGYWQQRADYAIKATLDTAARRIDAHRADPLHQPLARYAPVRLDAARPEPVPAGQHGLPAVRRGESVRRGRISRAASTS